MAAAMPLRSIVSSASCGFHGGNTPEVLTWPDSRTASRKKSGMVWQWTSIRTEHRFAHYTSILVELARQMLAEGLGPQERRLAALAGEEALHVVVAGDALHVGRDPAHDGLRRAGRREQAIPDGRVHGEAELRQGGHVGQRGDAARVRDAERADAAALDVRHGLDQRGEQQV